MWVPGFENGEEYMVYSCIDFDHFVFKLPAIHQLCRSAMLQN